MPRSREYGSASQRQAAYRAREAGKEERLRACLYRLEAAVWEASYRGDPLAMRCRDSSIEGMLVRLAEAFEQAGAPDPPPQKETAR